MRTGTFPVFTIVAVPAIRPLTSLREASRTESGNGTAALSTRTSLAEAPIPTRALAVRASRRLMPAAPMSASRSSRGTRGRDKATCLTEIEPRLWSLALRTQLCLPEISRI